MKPSIYLESSVISYFVARPSQDIITRGHQETTHQWWNSQLPRYDVFVSELVLNEIGSGDSDAAQKRTQAVHAFEVVRISQDAIDLASKYVAELPLLRDAEADALHLALAVLNNVNFLVTWNCKHIARGSVLKALPLVNMRLGLATPVICTPEELLYENDKDMV
jgi:hypothetical protein